MSQLRVFISSVQKELELERGAVAGLISTDPFLRQHCVPVRHDKEPPTGRPAEKAYLDSLRSCHLYLLLVDVEYGRLAGDLSATHEEYREAQTLAAIDRMEQRGTGFARMRDAMLNHGLDEPRLDLQDGFFVVTLPGPAGNYDRLRVPADAAGPISPAVEMQLTERQKSILQQVLSAGFVTNGWCRRTFGRAYFSVYRDLEKLQEMGLLRREGRGRATRYVLKVEA